jgi:hypothetical protein
MPGKGRRAGDTFLARLLKAGFRSPGEFFMAFANRTQGRMARVLGYRTPGSISREYRRWLEANFRKRKQA